MRAGELPLELIRMKAKGCSVGLAYNEPGFTLPSNIGELGDNIAQLDLSKCSLRGVCVEPDIHKKEANRGNFLARSLCTQARSRPSSGG